MLSPTWASEAEFLGNEEYDGHNAYRWDMKGFESNLLVETTEVEPNDRKVLLIDQDPQDYTKFHYESFTRTLSDSDIGNISFNLNLTMLYSHPRLLQSKPKMFVIFILYSVQKTLGAENIQKLSIMNYL